jgi:hypothetical protein
VLSAAGTRLSEAQFNDLMGRLASAAQEQTARAARIRNVLGIVTELFDVAKVAALFA